MAIERKCAIVTDVDMVVSGINKNSIKKSWPEGFVSHL